MQEFSRALRDLKLSFSDAEVRKVVDAVDVNKNGAVNYTEFVAAFKVADMSYATADSGGASASGSGARASPSSDPRSWQRGVIDRIVSTLFEYRLELASAFRMFDTNGDGIITREEFRHGLVALTNLAGSPVTDMQADELMRVLDKDNSGTIDFAEVSISETLSAQTNKRAAAVALTGVA